jgi:hypothetical protein
MSGKAGLQRLCEGTYNDNRCRASASMVDVDKGRFKYPDLPAAWRTSTWTCNITSPEGNDMDKMVVDLKRFAMKMAGNPVEARMYLTTPMSDPNVDAELKANLDLASVKTVVPMKDELKGNFTADVRMKGRMSDVEKATLREVQGGRLD